MLNKEFFCSKMLKNIYAIRINIFGIILNLNKKQKAWRKSI